MKTTVSILNEAQKTLFTADLGLKLLKGTNPRGRLAGLRNLIVFGRAVTNVLQNLRSTEGQRFDDWYQNKVEEMKKDTISNYFYKLRSMILKEGTLNVHSSVKSSGSSSSISSIMQKFQAPPDAKWFFIGDKIGGCGWLVQTEEGYTEKYYVKIPDNIFGFDLTINIHFSEALESLQDSNTVDLANQYIDYLMRLVDEAQKQFVIR